MRPRCLRGRLGRFSMTGKPLYFIFRYTNATEGIDTAKEHVVVHDALGYVWWGKFGLGTSKEIASKINNQIGRGYL